MAMSPVVSAAWASVSGSQVGLAALALTVFHTPPEDDPAYRTFALVGSAARAVMRPPAESVPGAVPLVIGAGPRAAQSVVLSGIPAAGTERSSRPSTDNRGRGAVRRRPGRSRRGPGRAPDCLKSFSHRRHVIVPMVPVSDAASRR